MSDLIERLRGPCSNSDFNGEHCKQRKSDKKWWCASCLAADEIERLNAWVDLIEADRIRLADANDALIEIGHKQHERIAKLESDDHE